MKIEDKIFIYGIGGFIVYQLVKGILAPVTTAVNAVTQDIAQATGPFQSAEGLHNALDRAGFTYNYSSGVTFVHSKDSNTTWSIRDSDIDQATYIKRRLELAQYIPGNDSWVFS